MVIMFRGTKASKNYAPQVLALYAGINAVKYGRRTLVLQLMREFPVEDILAGRVNRAGEINGVGYRYESNNIDSLLRQAGMREVEKEQFDLCGMQMLTEKDKLNVIRISTRLEFEKDLVSQSEDVYKVIEAAKKDFDDIYILGNGKNHAMMEKINPMTDLSIICVPQGNMEEVPEMETYEKEEENENPELEDDYEYIEREEEKPKKKVKAKPLNNILLMITNYDKGSAFSADRIAKAYGVKQGRVALFPYNVAFKDAYNTDSVLQFAMKNTKVYRGDDNFELMRCVFDVMKKVMGQNFPEEEEMAFPGIKQKIEEAQKKELMVLNKGNVIYTKRYYGPFGMFSKEGYEVVLDDEEEPLDLSSGDGILPLIEEKKDKGFLSGLFRKKEKPAVTEENPGEDEPEEEDEYEDNDAPETGKGSYDAFEEYENNDGYDEDEEEEWDIPEDSDPGFDGVDDFEDDRVLGYRNRDEEYEEDLKTVRKAARKAIRPEKGKAKPAPARRPQARRR